MQSGFKKGGRRREIDNSEQTFHMVRCKAVLDVKLFGLLDECLILGVENSKPQKSPSC